LNIVKDENIDELIEKISAEYLKEFGIKLDAYTVETADGTSIII